MGEQISIGIMADKCGITIKRLRDWCDAGLVEYEMKPKGRHIDENEVPKIKRAKELFDEKGMNRTTEDVREILIDEKYITPVTTIQKQVSPEEMLEAMGRALNEQFATKEDIKNIASQLFAIAQELTNQQNLIGRELAQKEDVWITKRRIEGELRREAIEAWNQKPESERFVKTGWFSKKEDEIKRNDFIQAYIEDHIMERYKQEIEQKP